jgi:large subunit ribosomal protein L5
MLSVKEQYLNSIPNLISNLKLRNKMEVPKIVKVSINMGLGKLSDAGKDSKLIGEASFELTQIAGQKAVVTKAKKSEAGFKLREGAPIGARVTLRGKRMYEFLSKLLNLALPRVRDFRGISKKSFDKNGNYNLGIEDILVFPEVDPTTSTKNKGMNITIVTTAKNDEEGVVLLSALGFPFKK